MDDFNDNDNDGQADFIKRVLLAAALLAFLICLIASYLALQGGGL